MKRKDLITTLILIFFALSLGASSFLLIKHVYDGDTVVLTSGEKVRYLGIDAPEIEHNGQKSEFMALESKNYNLQTVRNRHVRLEFDEERKDRYGRLLAYVFLDNGEMVNALMVKKGLAFVLTNKPNMKFLPFLLDCQRKAMSEKAGIWGKAPEEKEAYYLGNRDSHRFHRPGCPLGKKISPYNLVRFKSPDKAYWEGYSPCRECKP